MTEMLDVIDEQENVTDTLPREFVIKHNLLHKGIWLIIKNSDGMVLIHRRSEDKPQSPGMWDIKISGLVVSGEAPLATCLREAEEEFGLKDTKPELLGRFIYRSKTYQDVSYAYRIIYDGELHPDPAEVAAYEWVAIKDLDTLRHDREFIGTSGYIMDNHMELLE